MIILKHIDQNTHILTHETMNATLLFRLLTHQFQVSNLKLPFRKCYVNSHSCMRSLVSLCKLFIFFKAFVSYQHFYRSLVAMLRSAQANLTLVAVIRATFDLKKAWFVLNRCAAEQFGCFCAASQFSRTQFGPNNYFF